MPWSAISNSPCLRSLASVNAPFSWPNSSLSRKVALSPAQLTSTNGALVRGAQVVDHPRHPPLAGAALAGEEHGGPLALGQEPHLVGEVLHARRRAQRIEAVARGGLPQQRLVDPAEARLVGHPGGRGGEVLHVHRLGEEVLGAELHGADRGGDVALAGEENDGGVPLPQVLEDLQAVHPRQAQVQDHHLGPQAIERGQPRLAAQLPGDLVRQPLEVVPDAAQNVDIVIDEEDGSGHWDALGSGRSKRVTHAHQKLVSSHQLANLTRPAP